MTTINLALLNIIRNNVTTISTILFTTIGILGNTLTLVILAHEKFRSYSANTYLALLAVSNTLRLALIWLNRVPGITESSSAACKILVLIRAGFYQYCNWIPVLIALDRFIAVCYPFYFQTTKKLKFQLGTLIGLLLFIVACNSYVFATHDVVKATVNGSSDSCTISEKFNTISSASLITFFSLILMPNILPFILMTVFTLLFAVNLFKSKSKFKRSLEKEKTFAATLIGLNIYFLLFNLPFGLTQTLVLYSRADQTSTAIMTLVSSIFSSLSLAHNALNFIVYLICNKTFRDECRSILCRNTPREAVTTKMTATRSAAKL